jgi:hypothetical protein
MNISSDPILAKNIILNIAQKKNIKWKFKKGQKFNNGIQASWYVFGHKQLIMENYNHGRSEIGLLTTQWNKTNDVNINDKLKWNDTFGKSTKRFKYYPFGKPISHIEHIFDIMIKVDELNKI